MPRHIVYCSVLFWAPIWVEAVADRLQETFNKSTLEYILIIYSVSSNCLDPECFSMHCQRFVRRPVESHNVRVCLWDNIVCCISVKKTLGGHTVRRYCALLLKHLRVRLQFDASVELSGNGTLHEKVRKPKSGILVYFIRIIRQFKRRQKAGNRAWV